VKAAFERAFQAMVVVLSREIRSTKQTPEETARAIAALCIGGMVVARSLADPKAADRVREAAANAALELGGWETGMEVAYSG
jgi:hypothetical protein